ncbi:hypothetical protein [Couchioplanes caeruleus]|uniref:N-acetyltransferase domain-containing protein n=2 Tax=Couchioplanes caeruleus TaxID=56438 RepID=A0A1K0FJW8_9ACTN|nr:hypothetical protein [Couchioplanes caeruleus]OJF13121.1 hypothetical protein BG844_16935 [Couchioplanes caeruleus subsp. caeruleus]ROP33362.1 hypothetical protein EDD30_6336 [Couchioplanes caeruleus]
MHDQARTVLLAELAARGVRTVFSGRAQSAIFMATTVTDPAYAGRRIGCQLAWWVLDHAARTGQQWVRRGTTEPGLVRYYRDVQGWEVVREKTRDGFTVTGLARRAQLRPGLSITTRELHQAAN